MYRTHMYDIIRDDVRTCENSAHTVGFRFHPTDTELMNYLLYYVVDIPFSELVPIRSKDLYSIEPWDIFVDKKERTLYFFTELKKKKRENTRYVRSVGKGSWKSQDKGKKVLSEKGSLLGHKRSLRYQNSESPHDGQWLMKEYSLCDHVKKQLRGCFGNYYKRENYVLCRVKRKGRIESPISKEEETIEFEELYDILHTPNGSPHLSNDEANLTLASGIYSH